MEEYSEKDKHDWYQRLKRHSFDKIFVVVCAFCAFSAVETNVHVRVTHCVIPRRLTRPAQT